MDQPKVDANPKLESQTSYSGYRTTKVHLPQDKGNNEHFPSNHYKRATLKPALEVVLVADDAQVRELREQPVEVVCVRVAVGVGPVVGRGAELGLVLQRGVP